MVTETLTKKDFEKACEALRKAHAPGPYKVIVAPYED